MPGIAPLHLDLHLAPGAFPEARQVLGDLDRAVGGREPKVLAVISPAASTAWVRIGLAEASAPPIRLEEALAFTAGVFLCSRQALDLGLQLGLPQVLHTPGLDPSLNSKGISGASCAER